MTNICGTINSYINTAENGVEVGEKVTLFPW